MFNILTTAMVTGIMIFNTVMPVNLTKTIQTTNIEPVKIENTETKINQKQNELLKNSRVVTVTAYTSMPNQTDSTPCISSDNTNICQRYAQGELICAAGDRNVPLGSKFYVEGYGTCTVADRMNIRYNGTGRVDIYLG